MHIIKGKWTAVSKLFLVFTSKQSAKFKVAVCKTSKNLLTVSSKVQWQWFSELSTTKVINIFLKTTI